jgi:hypothetical protein
MAFVIAFGRDAAAKGYSLVLCGNIDRVIAFCCDETLGFHVASCFHCENVARPWTRCWSSRNLV